MTTEPTKSATPRMEAMFIALKNGDGISEGCEDYYSLGCKIETELAAANERVKDLESNNRYQRGYDATSTPITDKHAFHRITGIASPDGDVVGVQISRELECQLNTQKELTECAEKNLYDLVALLSGKTPETYNARVKEIADGFLKRITEATQPLQKELEEANHAIEIGREAFDRIRQLVGDDQSGMPCEGLVQLKICKMEAERDQLKQQLAEAVKALKIALDCAYWKGQYPYEHLPEFRTAISAAMKNPTKEP